LVDYVKLEFENFLIFKAICLVVHRFDFVIRTFQRAG